MAEGGMLAWKRQVVDTSRGPAGSYRKMSLPDLPEGVVWTQNKDTKEWTLTTADPDSKGRRKYKIERSTVWNARTGREQLAVRMRPVSKSGLGNDGVLGCVDDETVATEVTSTINNDDEEEEDVSDLYFNEKDIQTEELDDNGPPEPVLGVDYIVHTVVPSDTFQGLCLRYKIKAMELRRVNRFSGSNLALAPAHLVVPLSSNRSVSSIKLQDTDSKEYKLQMVLAEYPHLQFTERKAYLEMNDWDVDLTLQDIANDSAWEQQEKVAKKKTTIGKTTKVDVSKKVPSHQSSIGDDVSPLTTPLLKKPFEME